MSQLIFDIETRGFEGDNLDPVVKENLLKHADSDEEKEGILARTGLWPVSGEIAAIAMLNPQSNKGKVYFQAPKGTITDYKDGDVEYLVKTEKEIVSNFWLDIKNFDQVITFNGRCFDVPFIIFRSILHNVKPTKNLMPNRYYKDVHYDLMDVLSFYGAFRKFSLEVLAQTFGIKNPKDEGVSGLVVNDLFKKQEYKKIAEYCMRDVVATRELYEKVKDFIY